MISSVLASDPSTLHPVTNSHPCSCHHQVPSSRDRRLQTWRAAAEHYHQHEFNGIVFVLCQNPIKLTKNPLPELLFHLLSYRIAQNYWINTDELQSRDRDSVLSPVSHSSADININSPHRPVCPTPGQLWRSSRNENHGSGCRHLS